MADTYDGATPSDRLRELVPEKLREAYHEDSILEACFATAAYGGLSRESALIQCVLQYRKQLASLRHEWAKQIAQRGIPPMLKLEARQLVHLRPDTLAKLRRFATEWTDQQGCGSHVLDELAAAAKRDLDPPRYVELLRRFVREWSGTERDPKTREYVGGRFDLLRELCEAFEEEELRG